MNVEEIRRFDGGHDLSSSDGIVPHNRPRELVGCRSVLNGKLVVTPGPQVIYAPGGGGLVSLARYEGTAIKRLLWSTGANVLAQDESVAIAPVNLGATTGTTIFDQMESVLLWTNSAGRPMVWRGTGTGYEAGIAAPTEGATRVDSGAGNLNSVGKGVPFYQWVYTFEDNDGVESGPSPTTLELSLNNRQCTVTAIRLAAYPARITKINWYRRGGSVGDFYKVGQSAVIADTLAYPNSAAIFVDNTLDVNVSTTLVPRYNDRPPLYASILKVHNNRAWYTGIPGSLKMYFSAIGNAEVVANDQKALATFGGFLTLPGGFDDMPLALSSTGSLLIIGRKKSVWALFGDNFAQFAFSERSNIGIVNATSMVRAVNHVYYVGTDRRVYRLGDDSSEWVSKDIQARLDAMSDAAFQTCVLAYNDNLLALSFGASAPDECHIYALPTSSDDISSGWTIETGMRSRFMIGAPRPTINKNELIFVAHDGTSVKRAFADTATERPFSYTSGEFVYNQGKTPAGGKTEIEVYSLAIEGMFTGSTDPTVQVSVGYPGDGVLVSQSYSMARATRDAYAGRVDGGMSGEYARVKIFGTVVPGSLLSLVAVGLTPGRSAF